MSNRRKLRSPAHIAAADQAFAHARQLSSETGTLTVVLDYAAEDRQCSWCNCPRGPGLYGPHARIPGYVCDGCPLPAEYDVHLMVATPDHALIPICKGHLPGVQTFLTDTFPGAGFSLEQHPS